MPVRKTQRNKIVQYLHKCADNIEKLVKGLKKSGDTSIPQGSVRSLQTQIAETTFALQYPESMKDEEE